MRDAGDPLTVDEAAAVFDAIGEALPPRQFVQLLRALLPAPPPTAAAAAPAGIQQGLAGGLADRNDASSLEAAW